MQWTAVIAMVGMLALAACTDASPEATSAPTPEPSALADLDCGDGQELAKTLSSGATWSMCWSVDPAFGLVLSEVHIAPPGAAPISIIGSLSISQLEVPYDTGERLTSDISESGFGGARMKTLEQESCIGDRLAADIPDAGDGTYGKTRNREVLCSEVVDGGLAYHSSELVSPAVARTEDWQLSTVSRVGWYEYVTQYVFGADGSVGVLLGATGDLSPFDYTDEDHGSAVGEGDHDHAASHSHNAVWRVHWALGGGSGMAVEQYDAAPTGEDGAQSPVLQGTTTPLPNPATAEWVDRRWWRVLAPDVLNDDGHPISYQIDLERSDSFTFVEDHHHGADAGYDVAFTNADDCQLYATRNAKLGCGDGVLDFVQRGAGQTLDDVVSWVAIGFHHVPRDEDQSPMEMHWQGFTLLPRDLTAQRFDVPEGHEELNGVPSDEWLDEQGYED
ncbi:copper amine oxidase [Microbacterium hydrocarbonoxydans]|uniref:copper amine oxidase n=1 Tax=Microbacterium hydrocarbonoxydans TaxID=273678 RepID=UPI003D97A23C